VRDRSRRGHRRAARRIRRPCHRGGVMTRSVEAAWVAFLLIAGVALAAIWTGAIGPDLDVRSVASQTSAGPHQTVLEIRNDSHADVTVTDVGLAVPGLRRVAAQLVGSDRGPRRFTETRLAHGQSVDVLLT